MALTNLNSFLTNLTGENAALVAKLQEVAAALNAKIKISDLLDGKVGDILTLLNDEEQAAGLIAPPADRNESVLLGEDLEPQIPGLCIVSDRYLVGGGLWGSVALIGPTRMPFQKLMPLLHTFADQLGEGMSGKRKDTPQAAAPRRTVIYKEDLE